MFIRESYANNKKYTKLTSNRWFGALAIDDAATWTYEFFQEFDVQVGAEASNDPAMYIAETGWPTQSSNSSESNDGAGSPQGDASVANLQSNSDSGNE